MNKFLVETHNFLHSSAIIHPSVSMDYCLLAIQDEKVIANWTEGRQLKITKMGS